MHDSEKKSDEFDDDLDEFDDDFAFEEDWDDIADEDVRGQDYAEVSVQEDGAHADAAAGSEDTTQNVLPGEEDAELGETEIPPEEAAVQNVPPSVGAQPEKIVPEVKKKKRSLVTVMTVLVIVLAIGVTAYNTLRQSLAPSLAPIINLAETPATPPENDFVSETQKRIDEIKKNAQVAESEEQSRKDDLMRPFEDDGNTDVAETTSVTDGGKTSALPEEPSVLTPFPTDLDEKASELPSLEEAVAQVELRRVEADGGETDLQPFPKESAQLSSQPEDDDQIPAITPSPFTPEEDILTDLREESDIADVVDARNESAEDTAAADIMEKGLAGMPDSPTEKDALSSNVPEKAEEAPAPEAETVRKPALENASRVQENAKEEKQAVVQEEPQNIAPSWTIRAVRPGRAVLYDERTGDIEAVEPGSKIRGLGRVKAVTKKDGKWVVLGSEGNITQ